MLLFLQYISFADCWMSDRIEKGIPLVSVPHLKLVGECSAACKNNPECDFFIYSPRMTEISFNYNDCLLSKRVNGEYENAVGKVTGYPGLEVGDCPALTGNLYKFIFKLC